MRYYVCMKALDQNKFLTDKELNSLLTLCNQHNGQRDSIIIRFTLFTGARGCEALAVRKRDLAGGAVTIQGAKGSNDRVVPLPTDFFQEVTDYARGMADDDRLFPIAVRTFRHIWNLYRPNHKKGAHCLRHTYGVRLYNNCRDKQAP